MIVSIYLPNSQFCHLLVAGYGEACQQATTPIQLTTLNEAQPGSDHVQFTTYLEELFTFYL
ncbi:hypothetical protein [Limosilactobacillus caccae]|uniref:hypothetical protein n=1 Tax=Limosilactobacillus caccae TaxID=1926284 RepID=UPI00117A01A0|nr:hypothetical protein [Limosilactobacillus caccae]